MVQDGTFDQLDPVERLQKGLSRKGRVFSSIDLSAATDRLPVRLQVILLEVLLVGRVPDPEGFAKA